MKRAVGRNSDVWKKYFEHCKKRSQGKFLPSQHHRCFAIEEGYAPYFEFDVPNMKNLKEGYDPQTESLPYASSRSQIKEDQTCTNLGILSLFIQRGPYSGTIYQPKINHRQLDIGNFMKENEKHPTPLIDTALGLNNYGFDDQSLVKVMPYKIVHKDLKGKRHPSSLQSFCAVSGEIDEEPFTNYLVLSDYIACDVDEETICKLYNLFGYKYQAVENEKYF